MTSQDTTGYSRYNALELNLRYGRTNGNVSIGYTTASRSMWRRISANR
jgi:hypothetical protein